MSIIKKIAESIAKTEYARRAITDGADLSEFKKKPTARNFLGIFLVCFSFIVSLPGVGLIAALSIYWHEPLLIIIGGPTLIIIAHLFFFAGMYLAGGKYLSALFRWATRVTIEKFM